MLRGSRPAARLFLVMFLASCAAPVGDRSLPPTPSPTLPPIAGAVTFTADQVILPPEQFPLSGYGVTTDKAVGADRWTRTWTGTDAFWWVQVDVTLLAPSAASADAIAKSVCDWTFTPPASSAAEIAAPVVGDGAKACGYDIASPASSMTYTTGTRNVLVTVGLNRRSITQAAAAIFMASLADYQLWIIEKLTPLAGVAVRPTPKVDVPGPAPTAQPALRPTPAPGTPVPTAAAAVTLNVDPRTADFGNVGACDGGSILQERFQVTAPPDVSWTVGASGSSFVNWALGSLDRASGSGSGTVTWIVKIAPQKHSVSGFTCNDYYRYPYGDTIMFTFSRGGAFLQRIDSHTTYTYLALY